MKKTRGDGFVYQPIYPYFVKGTRFRELSNSRSRQEAEVFLQERLKAAAQGNLVRSKANKATFVDLAKILLDDYRANGRRSVGRVEDTVKHLHQFFAAIAVSQISADLIARYVSARQEEEAAPQRSTGRLGALRRAFRLAQFVGKVASRPEISMLPEGNPRISSLSLRISIFMKPRGSETVLVRSTEAIGIFATRYSTSSRRASDSFRPTRASSGSVNMQNDTRRCFVVRLPPFKLECTTRKSL
jgi:hypothetical protein